MSPNQENLLPSTTNLPFHASLTNWGGKLDLSSMYLFIDYWVLFNVARIYGLAPSTFLQLYCSTTALLLIPRVLFDALGLPIFVVLMAAAVLMEIVVSMPASVGLLGSTFCGIRT